MAYPATLAQLVPRPHRYAFACEALRAGSNELMFYTYVLLSKKDGKLYVGFCEDLRIRFKQHSLGLVTATKSRRPLELVYYEACQDKQDAIDRERQLKTGFGRAYLNRRLKVSNKILPP